MVRPECFGMSVRIAAVDGSECLQTLSHSVDTLSRGGCCTVSAESAVMHRGAEGLDVSRQGVPAYRRTADEILSMIASGKLGQKFTVPEVEEQAGVNRYAARKAAEHLAGQGLIEPYQGSGYRALVTPEEAAASRVDDRPMREQVAELQKELAELRKRTGRIEARLATLAGKSRGGKREQADTAVSDGRR